jgi:L-lactate utilization protein LutC
MGKWSDAASSASVEKAAAALRAKGIETFVAETGKEAKAKALELIPAGAEVFTASSVTVDSIGLSDELNGSGKYDAVKPKLYAMDPKSKGREMRKLGAAPDFAVGSAHALTETGTLVAASLTGSQLPAYAYGAGTLIWIIGSQKIVADLDEAMRRLEEHVVPLESARARKAYGLPESFKSAANKILILNAEANPARVKVIIVKEAIGF